jgi:putative endonuclease
MDKQYYVYIVTNDHNTVLYTGVTNDLKRRVYEHESELVEGFTKRYNLTKLVYYEVCESIEGAIGREKKLKGGSRLMKAYLVESINKGWRDLYDGLGFYNDCFASLAMTRKRGLLCHCEERGDEAIFEVLGC